VSAVSDLPHIGSPPLRDPAGSPAQERPRPRGPHTRHRIFVAVKLAPHLQEAIARVPSRFESVASALRWVPVGNLHLTLRFLGEITEAQVKRVGEATHAVALGASPFTITLAGLGAFPSPLRPRVVWVGVAEGSQRLVALAEALNEEIVRRKFPREPRPFQPHLTVARARTGVSPLDLTGDLARAGAPVIGSQEVAALTIMESFLRTSGSAYQEVAQERLQGSR
jgi:RNA 2',3'-cyclic 3'-phosphodiesterase